MMTARTRIEREFDPVAIRRLIDTADADLTIGGPDLAGQAIAARLVDECHLFLVPVIVGAGKPALPRDMRRQLELVGLRRFAGGVVYLHYRFTE